VLHRSRTTKLLIVQSKNMDHVSKDAERLATTVRHFISYFFQRVVPPISIPLHDSPPSHRTPYPGITPCRFARPNLPCPYLQTPPPNLRIGFCKDTISYQIFVSLPQDEAAEAAIGCSWTTKDVLGCLWRLSAVSADEEELLEGEAKRSGETKA
jgi:hypothetical protein